jgi:membrane-bound serine protease (ClpP class)
MEDLMLFILGVTLLAIEIFVTPGFGVLGMTGLVLMLLSLLNSMSLPAPGQPWMPVPPDLSSLGPAFNKLITGMVGAGVLALLAGRFLPKSRLARPLVLHESEVFRNAPDSADRVGWTGTAHTALRPSGSALFEGEPLDVVTRGEFIDKGTPIRIMEQHGNRMVVQAVGADEEKKA